MNWWRRYWKLVLVLAVVAGMVLLQWSGRRGDNRIAPDMPDPSSSAGHRLRP